MPEDERPRRYVGVVPLAPVEGVFTYAVPEALAAEAVVGARVVVPFGSRSITGVVAEHRPGDDGAAARELVDVLDEGPDATAPAVSAEGLALTRWVAEYYLCSWGEALRAALPPGTDAASRRVVRATGAPAGDLAGDDRRVVEALFERGAAGIPRSGLDRAAGVHVRDAALRRLADAGVVEIVQEVAAPRVRTRTVTHLRLATPRDEARAAVRGPRQLALVDALARAGAPMPKAAALAASGASSAAVKSLVDRGLVATTEVVAERIEDAGPAVAGAPAIALHGGQSAALDAIESALAEGEPRTFLLHGVTGSGKTEVYIRALNSTLARGRTALVLVPEIALTPQTVRRFRAHFGDSVAVLHSRMSDGERLDAWRALRAGRRTVAVGPRSAVFAPLNNLGLVVVDEEHEGSYKQFDPAPRYNARDVAVWRAHQAGAVCVLGSATPSLESLANARAGKYRLLTMPERVPVGGLLPAPMPPVRVVDLTWEKKTRRLKGALSDPLRDALTLRLQRGEQAILLQNRRGYAPVLTCEDCGASPQCRDCAVTMTVHKTRRQLRCHYCGRAERLPSHCSECGSANLTNVGAGTQRVEEELAEVLPEARVLRMDLDTTSGRGAHRKLLDRFGAGDADILLGTQMVAKGLDFPRVTLVGVVDADTGMRMPDFRAAERSFQLLAQVAGRAGRAELEGEVILQTRNPTHPAVRFAVEHDYAGFAAHELNERHALGYPPFGRIVGVEFKGPDDSEVAGLAARWTAALRDVAREHREVRVLGPAPAFIGRVKGQYRHHALLRTPRRIAAATIGDLVRAAGAAAGRPPARCRVNVDVDPVGLF